MSASHQLTWENFKATVYRLGEERVHLVTDSPYIEVFGDGVSNRIGIWLEAPVNTPPPAELVALEFMAARTLYRNKHQILEIATSSPTLQRQFYHFAMAIAERMIVDKLPAIDAVSLELKCFAELLAAKPLLGIERQIGLLGELAFLSHLIERRGASALDSWVGPLREPHDFKVGNKEFEVKSTVTSRRVHTIHGTEQLLPSAGCTLYLVSVLMGPPGTGESFSLAEQVARLSDGFPGVRLAQFISLLEGYGYRDADRAHYARRFAFRRPLGIVRIDNTFPAISRLTIQRALGPLAARVEALQYDVDVEGLEFEQGAPEFANAVAS